MKLSFNQITIFFVIISSLYACVDVCDKESDIYGTYALHFHFIDENGRNLLEIGRNRYRRDTVEILDEQQNPLGLHPDTDGSMVLDFLRYPLDREEPLNTPLERTFYVYFEEGDYDTLNIAYRIGIDECNDQVLTQWSVSYRDSLYVDFTADPPNTKSVYFIK